MRSNKNPNFDPCLTASSSGSCRQIPETLILIPGLPNDVSAVILSHIPFSHHARLRSTCRSWKSFISSNNFISFRRWHLNPSRLSNLLCLFPQDPSISSPYLFDPHTLGWCPLPPMPCDSQLYGLCNFAPVAMGAYVYVIGGSLFDARSYPMDRPSPSSAAFRCNVVSGSWDRLAPMISPRGSFACVAVPNADRILVAGGGSRHTIFRAAGSRLSSAEMYDVRKDEWVEINRMPRYRAGCVGFLVGNSGHKEFLVMGGYGESRTISGVFPVDSHYKDAVVMGVNDGGKWRELGDTVEQGERVNLGKMAALDDEDGQDAIFMLQGKKIFRYEMGLNRWGVETCVPREAASGENELGFAALCGEIYVMGAVDSFRGRRRSTTQQGRTMYLQIYNPGRKEWRSLTTTPPLKPPLDFRTTVFCTIRL